MRRIAYVYAGRGASRRCVRALHRSLESLAVRFDLVCRCIDAASLHRGEWQERAALVCMPGGRDLPYTWDLSRRALDSIRRFVRRGGLYVGSCAGAYFASHSLAFRAARVPVVTGTRPLRLLAAHASGPSQAAASFAYAQGVAAGERQLTLEATLCWGERGARAWQVVNQGGCTLAPLGGRWRRHEHPLFFLSPRNESVTRGAAGQAVIVRAAYGRGRVLLIGAHPELTTEVAIASEGARDRAVSGTRAFASLVSSALCAPRVPTKKHREA